MPGCMMEWAGSGGRDRGPGSSNWTASQSRAAIVQMASSIWRWSALKVVHGAKIFVSGHHRTASLMPGWENNGRPGARPGLLMSSKLPTHIQLIYIYIPNTKHTCPAQHSGFCYSVTWSDLGVWHVPGCIDTIDQIARGLVRSNSAHRAAGRLDASRATFSICRSDHILIIR